MLVMLFLFFSYQIHLGTCQTKNVCKTIKDYENIETNRNCWYNPDVEAHPKDIAERYGFPFESYQLKTEDGYFVTLFRIPHNGTTSIDSKRPVIFLQHGIGVDGASWMALGLNSSVFIFANNGFDVWIANFRGTQYASKHQKYSTQDKKYWLYSFHELAIFDLDAMIDFIVKKTDQRGQITYIGHSMGTTMSFVYSSLLPKKAKANLKKIIALAPITSFKNNKSGIKIFALYRNMLANIFESFNVYGVGLNLKYLLNEMHSFCTKYPIIVFCENLVDISSGVNFHELNPAVIPFEFRRYPFGISLKTLYHYAQIMDSDRFRFFNYKKDVNKRMYNCSISPDYPLSQIEVPYILLYGKNDLLTAEKDVFHIYNTLTGNKSIEEVLHFSHLDFLYGQHAPNLYLKLLSYL